MTLISKSALTELAVGNWNHVTQWAAYLAYDKSEILFATYQFSKAFKKSKITVISERVQILKNPNQRQLHAYHKRCQALCATPQGPRALAEGPLWGPGWAKWSSRWWSLQVWSPPEFRTLLLFSHKTRPLWMGMTSNSEVTELPTDIHIHTNCSKANSQGFVGITVQNYDQLINFFILPTESCYFWEGGRLYKFTTNILKLWREKFHLKK